MIFLTCLLSEPEWQHLEHQARLSFPGELLSRSEIVRRFALAGSSNLNQLPLPARARLSLALELSQVLEDEPPPTDEIKRPPSQRLKKPASPPAQLSAST
jgi:hypothetical protein